MWDYLIVTASNDAQARAYEHQLALRQTLGLIQDVRKVLVIADPGGKRIGSGGSTLCCLLEVLNRHIRDTDGDPLKPDTWQAVFQNLRILIVHAGGDSKRLPAYSPCGKIFVPVPGHNDSALPLTLFDRQLPKYLALPPGPVNAGQIVVTAGDVMLQFDPKEAQLNHTGLVGLGSFALPEHACHHGVYCRDQTHTVTCYLQKPTPEQQQAAGAVDLYGQAVLDMGVMSFDGATAAQLLSVCGLKPGHQVPLAIHGLLGQGVFDRELDFYREICAALGTAATEDHYLHTVKQSGSDWDTVTLKTLHQGLRSIAFHVNALTHCDFLHFGTTRQIITSAYALIQHERINTAPREVLSLNNHISDTGRIQGVTSLVEGCHIQDALTLAGDNVVAGVDVLRPISLPRGICLDVTPGQDRYFVRIYSSRDKLNDRIDQGATFCGMPVADWLGHCQASADTVWDTVQSEGQQTLWTAKLFPAIPAQADLHDWLWMADPASAAPEQIQRWHNAERFSSEEIASLADHQAFHSRRTHLRGVSVMQSLPELFRHDSCFSSQDLIHCLQHTDPSGLVSAILDTARLSQDHPQNTLGALILPRILHTLGDALRTCRTDLARVSPQLTRATRDWTQQIGLPLTGPVTDWADKACAKAFQVAGTVIIAGGLDHDCLPKCVLRSDEIIWARAPARFDTGGGWTDTPPYALEHGGCVVNTAVNLNGQAPIQAYLRVIKAPVIRLASIDLGRRIEITTLADLCDFREATSEYGLAKAALALSGFSPDTHLWPDNVTLEAMLTQFGGGIELTTLAAIPKGSGLGTSSIMGAVILSAIQRAFGKTLTQKELFHAVLCLEQLLTTGGGWQDQIGGAVGGVKIVTAEAGLMPSPTIHYLPTDLLDPALNQGCTLLYYTGITRLAKNILAQVVGRTFSRDRQSLATLERIGQVALQIADTLSRKDLKGFGRLVGTAWELNKQLDPNSSNPEVEALFDRVSPFIYGGKLLGAGGGGFMLMVCKSPDHARRLKVELDSHPTNDRARFFDYSVNPRGLTVTVC
jgi:galactokinase/mevalonate kinase-like predicted kinase